MNKMVMESPIGNLSIRVDQGAVVEIDIFREAHSKSEHPALSPLLETVRQQLMHYFDEARPLQSLPLRLEGTPFQQRVWSALCKIPLGSVMTYGELAHQLNTSPRAVGGACRNNPIPLIVPCHRVISAQGIGGFSGQWREGGKVDTKRWLLAHEGVRID